MLDDKCYGEKYSREGVCVDTGGGQQSSEQESIVIGFIF